MTAPSRKIADSAKKTAASAKKTEELAEAASAPEKKSETKAPEPVKKPVRRHAKAEHEDTPEPTHRVLRQIVIDGEQREVDDLVHLDGLEASALESHGYVLKATKEPDDKKSSGSKSED
jgi:hypothetical protein